MNDASIFLEKNKCNACRNLERNLLLQREIYKYEKSHDIENSSISWLLTEGY